MFHSLLLLSSSLKALSSVRKISSTTPVACESVDWGFWLSSKSVLDSVESANVSVSCKKKRNKYYRDVGMMLKNIRHEIF